MTPASALRRSAARLDDLLRYRRTPQAIQSLFRLACALALPARHPGWLEHACAAARCAPSQEWMRVVEGWTLARLDRLSRADLWSWQEPETPQVGVAKAAILKPSSERERGVLFISFESQWQHLLRLGPHRLAALAARYQLVVAPTWSPPHSVTNYLFPRLHPGTLPCTISNVEDLRIFPRLHPSYEPVRLFASSWVNASLYQPQPREKRDIDLVMVANFGRYKRHHVLFSALARMPPAQRPKVTLIGQPHGQRTVEVLEREMHDHGVRDCITLRSRISDAEVVDLLGRSKAALITSLREGSCVAVVEAMMADTPIALLKGACIGSACFIEKQTGAFLNEDRLPEQLPAFISAARDLTPRRRLLELGVEHESSTRLLEEHLKSLALSRGEPWTRGLFAHHWRPDPLIAESSQAREAAQAASRLATEFGLLLNPPKS